MDWLLALMALINLVVMYTVFQPRTTVRDSIPWGAFGVTLLATELAWFWLPLQVTLSLLMCIGGALSTALGELALLVLLVTWAGFGWSIWQALHADEVLESALESGLGSDYRRDIPTERSEQLRESVSFDDWKHPFRWPRPGVEVLRDIPYAPGGMRQQLDIYRPEFIPEGGCPVLLQIHGGAWTLSKKDDQALPLMYHLAARGWICVAANYRLSPSVGFPTHLEDCKRALCWVRENGKAYGMDTGFVAVTGGSAGGHLAALMGLTANLPELQTDHPLVDTSLQAAVPFYGLYDFLGRYDQHHSRETLLKFLRHRVMYETEEENPKLWDLASPITHLREDAPPFMVLHGTHDSLIPVDDARVFVQRLRSVSTAPVVYAEMPWAEHGFELLHSIRAEHTINAVHRFLEWSLAQHRMQAAQDVDAETAAGE
ncbi:alpha/beta hydrolase [Mangrovimicrobium sediminis]|uniref:Alpha/beta hydrolase n=1 Tax=Mangrovimicrobium sediminis TaxID=2562682 RepID=A0A4Z0LZU6_9GAMM|nr:alpha/beta hydrolase [Haliea sp. SAOS-164]TGD72791.1 alpha/beta hydrolase [Haliea sp. SAOS-164]